MGFRFRILHPVHLNHGGVRYNSFPGNFRYQPVVLSVSSKGSLCDSNECLYET